MQHGRIRMKYVFGLGNPGRKYENTRHNAGFRVISIVSQQYGIRLKEKPKLEAKLGNGIIDGVQVMLAEPQTFMNNSGWAVSAVADYYRADPADIIVIYDDIDLPFGVLRIRERGSAGTHNGMRSVISYLGTEDVVRLRIGIGRPDTDLKDYVLGRFADPEAARAVFARAADALICLLTQGVAAAQREYREEPK